MNRDEATVVPSWYRPPGHPHRAAAIAVAQTMLGLPATGEEDELFVTTLGGLSRVQGYTRTTPGLNHMDAAMLGERPGGTHTPAWWAGPKPFHDYQDHLASHHIPDVAALRRFQSESYIPPTGVVDLETAQALSQWE